MKPPDAPFPEAWLDDRLEAYLDGALPAEEAEAVAAGLADPVWADALRQAGRIRDGLRRLPAPPCPPHVTRAVLREARRRARTAWRRRLADRLAEGWAALWQPALAMAVLLALVVAAALTAPPPRPTPAGTSTPVADARVQRALAEVKWTLALLSEVGRQTGASVRREVLDPHVLGSLPEAPAAPPSEPPN